MKEEQKSFFYKKSFYSNILWISVGIALKLLIFNLFLHVLLRGVWIGSLGLRFVSGSIDFDALNYSPKFTNYLKKNVGSFDQFILNLEKFCSVLFSISFLMVFYIFSFFIYISLLILVSNSITENENVIDYALGIFAYVFFIIAIINLIDFFGQGLLKRKKWTSKLYYPIYRFMSWVTLSFLYRPLLYNLLDHKAGRRITALLIPVYVIILVVFSSGYSQSNFFDTKKSFENNQHVSSHHFYEDQLEGKKYVKLISIPSKVIESSNLQVFIKHRERIEDTLVKYNDVLKNLRPKDKRGSFAFTNSYNSDEAVYDTYITTFKEFFHLELNNNNKIDADFTINFKENGEMGFFTALPLNTLPPGKQTLNFYYKNPADSLSRKVIAAIPFWYYP